MGVGWPVMMMLAMAMFVHAHTIHGTMLRGKDRIPTIHFQVQAVSFREGTNLQESYNTPLEHTPGNPPTQL